MEAEVRDDVVSIETTDHLPPEFNALAMAFLGDAVYELHMRSCLLHGKQLKAAQLSKASAALACAAKQATLARALEPLLSETELAILKRGRNAKPRHQPRGEVLNYRWATGLETLLGYLYHHNKQQRLQEILQWLWQQGAELNPGKDEIECLN